MHGHAAWIGSYSSMREIMDKIPPDRISLHMYIQATVPSCAVRTTAVIYS